MYRSEVGDTALPYLWTDEEVWRYMNDAYRMYVRLTGGVGDITSSITSVDIVAGEATAEVSPLILKYREATLDSTGKKLIVANYTDVLSSVDTDYANLRSLYENRTPGAIQAMVIGEDVNRKRGIVRWIQIPQVDDIVKLSVLRLPLETIDGPGYEFDDIGEEHHEALLMWMKHRAYAKQDAETFDKGKCTEFKQSFEDYCGFAKSEVERNKSKVRIVSYGGI